MKTRLIKNWITTVIGLVLLAGASYVFYISKITWQEYVAFIPLCLLMLRAKDSLLWGKAK